MSRPPQPTRFEAWLEQRFPPYRFGVVFVLLVGTYVVMAASPPNAAVRIVTVLLEGLTLIATLLAARVRGILFRVAGAVVIGALVAAVGSLLLSSSDTVTGWFFAINVLLVGAAPIAIGRALYRRPVIDARTVLGAICVYLLIGIMYAFLYASIAAIGASPFFVQTDTPGIQVFLYFSFVTQTTVGYGDYTAATDLGRTLATTEALLGQIYLVTVVAVLVSRMTVMKRGDGDDGARGAGDAGAAADE